MLEKHLICHGIFRDGNTSYREGTGSTEITVMYNEDNTLPSDEDIATFIICPYITHFLNDCRMPIDSIDANGNQIVKHPYPSKCKYERIRLSKPRGYINIENKCVRPEQILAEILE